MALWLLCRARIAVELIRASVEIRFVWSGIPGYIMRQYDSAPVEVRLRLATAVKWQRILLVNLVLSIPLSLLVAGPALRGRP